MSRIGKLLPEPLRYRAWCWKKFLLEAEIRLAARLTKPDSRAIDVGANAGAYSFFMKRAGARVEAFEPVPELAEKLREQFGQSITVHEVAASNQNSATRLYAPIINGEIRYGYASCENSWDQSDQKILNVNTRTIDSFNFDNVSLMKIDVEGYELAVLEGATKTIEKNRPVLIIEAEERHRKNALPSVAEFLRPWGYKGSFLQNGKENPLESFQQSRDQALPQAKNYICNFIFKS